MALGDTLAGADDVGVSEGRVFGTRGLPDTQLSTKYDWCRSRHSLVTCPVESAGVPSPSSR
ncbi:hypothetical protein CVV72_41205 (plasmid) [Amycolatopsis sp. TNS106]|nr:hypothetical protein CVV72_41205 [Amycolatopsis sp. TNS106]